MASASLQKQHVDIYVTSEVGGGWGGVLIIFSYLNFPQKQGLRLAFIQNMNSDTKKIIILHHLGIFSKLKK